MTEIQQAFEKWAIEYGGYESQDFEKFPTQYKDDVWNGEKRAYKFFQTELDFRTFKAGWEARGKV